LYFSLHYILDIVPFQIVPEVKDPLVTPSQSEKEGEDSPTQSKKKKEKASSDIIKDIPRAEASHINLFMWLRIMLQQLQGEQIHRTAAIRLMFESAAAGMFYHLHMYVYIYIYG
jgi:MarR-like DNA-binding transcriptional regulator SgrR of sgrS sRNA